MEVLSVEIRQFDKSSPIQNVAIITVKTEQTAPPQSLQDSGDVDGGDAENLAQFTLS
jgi:hypothetical protein